MANSDLLPSLASVALVTIHSPTLALPAGWVVSLKAKAWPPT